jgi:hypothetical protein
VSACAVAFASVGNVSGQTPQPNEGSLFDASRIALPFFAPLALPPFFGAAFVFAGFFAAGSFLGLSA